MKLSNKILVAIFILITSAGVSKATQHQEFRATNSTFVRTTFYFPKDVPCHPLMLCFLLEENEALTLSTENIKQFTKQIFPRAKHIPVCHFGFPYSTYFKLWGRSEEIYQSGVEFQMLMNEKLNEFGTTKTFSLDDGTQVEAEYIDLSGIYLIEPAAEANKGCSIEYPLDDFDISESWSLIYAVAFKKTAGDPLILPQ